MGGWATVIACQIMLGPDNGKRNKNSHILLRNNTDIHSGGKHLKPQEDGEKEVASDESREQYKQLCERERC